MYCFCHGEGGVLKKKSTKKRAQKNTRHQTKQYVNPSLGASSKKSAKKYVYETWVASNEQIHLF